MDKKEPSLLEKLQNMSTQTGGKGTMRRKKVIKSNNISLKNRNKSLEEINLERILKNINTKLYDFDPDTYELANAYLNEEANIFFSGTCRWDIKKKAELNNIRKQGDELLSKFFIKKNDDNKRTVLICDYLKIAEIFTHDGILNIIEFFEDTYKTISKTKFVEQELEQDKEEMTIRECFELLGLDHQNIPDANTVSKAFRKKAIACHPDKNPEDKEKYEELFKKLNKAKKIVKEYYNHK